MSTTTQHGVSGVDGHPTMLLADLKLWTVTRQTMDPKKGDQGFVRFSVAAPTAAIAKLMVDQQVTRINLDYMEKHKVTFDGGLERPRRRKAGKRHDD